MRFTGERRGRYGCDRDRDHRSGRAIVRLLRAAAERVARHRRCVGCHSDLGTSAALRPGELDFCAECLDAAHLVMGEGELGGEA
jgi:hypothetical protein